MCEGMFSPKYKTEDDPLGPCVLCGKLLREHVKKENQKTPNVEIKIIRMRTDIGRPRIQPKDESHRKKLERNRRYYARQKTESA